VSDINLGELYRDSSFDYSDEVHGLSRTYGKIVKKALGSRKPTGSILEIGGGTSFFLEEAIRIGFTKVSGVEPSKDSVRSTRADIKPFVTLGLMQEDLFPENSFDVVTMFHVMDHLPSPLETVKSCVSTLKVGGIFISAVHNEKSWSSRLFGEKSPIFDVEHTYLYSKKTAIALFKKAGLSEIRAYAYFNFYSLAYLLHLIPIPIKIKKLILNSKVGDLLSKVKLYVPLGNIFIVGKK
jgi:SAM-dependent methyltransferase